MIHSHVTLILFQRRLERQESSGKSHESVGRFFGLFLEAKKKKKKLLRVLFLEKQQFKEVKDCNRISSLLDSSDCNERKMYSSPSSFSSSSSIRRKNNMNSSSLRRRDTFLCPSSSSSSAFLYDHHLNHSPNNYSSVNVNPLYQSMIYPSASVSSFNHHNNSNNNYLSYSSSFRNKNKDHLNGNGNFLFNRRDRIKEKTSPDTRFTLNHNYNHNNLLKNRTNNFRSNHLDSSSPSKSMLLRSCSNLIHRFSSRLKGINGSEKENHSFRLDNKREEDDEEDNRRRKSLLPPKNNSVATEPEVLSCSSSSASSQETKEDDVTLVVSNKKSSLKNRQHLPKTLFVSSLNSFKRRV